MSAHERKTTTVVTEFQEVYRDSDGHVILLADAYVDGADEPANSYVYDPGASETDDQ